MGPLFSPGMHGFYIYGGIVGDRVPDKRIGLLRCSTSCLCTVVLDLQDACVSSSTVPRFAVAVQVVLSVRLELDHVQTGGDQQGNKLKQQLLR
jgi:nitrate/nitrite transporter NarK